MSQLPSTLHLLVLSLAAIPLIGCVHQDISQEIAKAAHHQVSITARQIDAKSASASSFYDKFTAITDKSFRERRTDNMIEFPYAKNFVNSHPDGKEINSDVVRKHMEGAVTDWSKREQALRNEREKSLTELESKRNSLYLDKQDIIALEAQLGALSKPRDKKKLFLFLGKYTKEVATELNKLKDTKKK